MASALAAVTAACGSSGDGDTDARPSVVVTTNVLGDMVAAALGDLVGTELDVAVIMPIGADPHDFAVSARQAESMEDADLLVVNGLGFEERMSDVIDTVAASGTTVFRVAEAALESEGGDDPSQNDPHVWMDPALMADAFAEFGRAVADATGIDADAVAVTVGAYVEELRQLDTEIDRILAAVPADRRTLVTNHDSLGHFARRYDFEIVGSVIPSLSTGAQASASDLEALADTIRRRDIPAIFAETTESGRLADALAVEVGGDVEVIELYSGSLGEPGSGADTYLGFMRVDAERIAAALGGAT